MGTDLWQKDFDYLYHYKSRSIFFIDSVLKKFPSPEMKPVIPLYESLLKKLENGMLLQMGFGTGWEGKSGTFLEDNRFLGEALMGWGRRPFFLILILK
jgi:hypothetical protein